MERLLTNFPKLDLFLDSDYTAEKDGIETLAKIRMLNFVCLVAISNLIILGLISMLQHNYLLGAVDHSAAIILTLLITYLRKSENYLIVSTMGVAIVGLLFIYLFLSGGVNNSAFLWYYTFPLFAYFLLGIKRGSLFTFTLLIVAFIAYFLSDQFDFITSYSDNLMLRFLPSFLVVILYSYIFEKTKVTTLKIVKNKNDQLSKTVKKLEIKEKELTKLHEDLEKRVEERTKELAKTNTKLKHEIEKKNKAKEEAEKSNQLKTEFLAQISHEIRTPVNTILSYSSLIKDDLNSNQINFYDDNFKAIQNGSRRLIRTIDSLVNMSQLQSGSFEVKHEKINLVDDIIFLLYGKFQSTANRKKVKLNLIDNSKSNKIVGDKYTLTQIFSNLIENAIIYTHKGSVDILIYRDNKEVLSVDIIDTGIGIAEEYLKTVFTPFSQEEQGYTRKYEGNGLGLALVKNYCQLNDAQIFVKSKKHVGTTFTVKFKTVNKN